MDQLKLDGVPDETTRAIDRFFDVIDNGVDTAQRLLNRSSQAEEKLQPKRRREVIDAGAEQVKKPTAKSPATARPAGAPTAVAKKKPHFYIVEATDPRSGDTIYVVTDGGAARTECPSREFAAQILKALEKAP